MIVRLRCKLGNFRYELQATDDIQTLVQKVQEIAPEAEKDTISFSNQPRGGETLVGGLKGPVSDFGIVHGDLVFVAWQERASTSAPIETKSTSSAVPSTSSNPNSAKASVKLSVVVEDPVDTFWEQQDGKIERQRDPNFCKHGDKAMCDYCMPVEPYDEKYQAEKKIKHLSYHSYLRKVDTAINKRSESSYLPPLEEQDFSVKVPCPSGAHASWPASICSKCQPSAITLQLQQYRMVDHVEYANPSLIEHFIDFWRRMGGAQRFGYLIGRYESYDQVPMGVKAVIEAIHEPPQHGDTDGLEVNMDWDDLSRVEALAARCGLKVVGMIYTDLIHDPDSKDPGAVVCKRHAESFFLSSLEAIFSARLQASRPNPSRFSRTGKYSSKFVTCVVTGNEKGEIEVKAYQASDQAMALVSADLVEASVNPGVVRVKQENDPPMDQPKGSKPAVKRYVPDVFYRYKNDYKIMVKESAKPCFPVDYLLVSLTHGFPAKSNPLFTSATLLKSFAIENRQGFEDQKAEAVLKRVGEINAKLPTTLAVDGLEISSPSSAKGKGKASDLEAYKELALWASDWHLLDFVQREMVGNLLEESDLKHFISVALAANGEEEALIKAIRQLITGSGWQTMVAFASESAATQPAASATDDFEIPPELLNDVSMDTAGGSGAATPSAGGAPPSAASGPINCPHCTFENPAGARDCEICGLPLQG